MTTLVCRSCGEEFKAPFRTARGDYECPCGGTRCLPSELKPRKPLRRSAGIGGHQPVPYDGPVEAPPRRKHSTLKQGRGFAASKAQREKVKGEPCVYCRRMESFAIGEGVLAVDPAHVWPRALGGCEHPDCVIPLCRPHHDAFDNHQLDVLSRLVTAGFWAEMAHPIAAHEVSPLTLLEHLTASRLELESPKGGVVA